MAYGSVSLAFGPMTADHAASTWAMKAWSRGSLKSLRVKPQVRGAELLPAGGYMYAANHLSMLDILVLGAVLPGDLKWAAKSSLMRIPFLGWHLALAGHVPVDRMGSARDAAETLRRFVGVLESGKQLLIFPEGTRSADGQLQAFKTGGFYAAVRANRPVVPVAVNGTHQLMGKEAANMGGADPIASREVTVTIGAPLHPMTTGKERRRVADLCRRSHAAVAGMLEEAESEPGHG